MSLATASPPPWVNATFVADAYLTDGRSLFRVIGPLTWREGRVRAELEDCLTLDARSYSPAELWEMELRVVRYGAG